MKNILFLVLLVFSVLFISCNKDMVVNETSNTVTRFSYTGVNDTLTIEFEVSGTQVSTPYKYLVGAFSSNNYYVKTNIESISNGSMAINVFKNDSVLVYNKSYTTAINSLDSSSCNPSLSYVGVTPVNFSGKGKFKVYVR